MPKTILLVCTGNSCRSVMAEALLRKMLKDKGIGEDKVLVKSAGVSAPEGASPTKDTIEVMWNLGIDVAEHRARRLNDDEIREADLILVMDRFHKEEIIKRAPGSRDKVLLLKEYNNPKGDKALPLVDGKAYPVDKDLDIQDPIGRPIDVYQDVLIDIQGALANVVVSLMERLK